MSLRLTICAALAAAALGCTAPPSGVHVVVTMADAEFDDDHLFDHLTVTATIGARTATACLYPADAVTEALAVTDPSPFACADHRTQPWTGPPSAQTWALAGKPRTVNVDAEPGEEVDVAVVGGLGGRLGTVRGGGKLVASSSFPELRVELARDQKVFPLGCDARLEPSLPEEFDTRYRVCDAGLTSCPDIDPLFRRSPAVTCLSDGTSRVRNGPGFTCGTQTGEANVWHTTALPSLVPCLRIFVTGHFVRCKSGDPLVEGGCEETTDCAADPVSLWSRLKTPDGLLISNPSMECIPPSIVPVTFSVRVKLPKEPVFLGIAQSVATAGDGACFLDVQSLATTAKDCAP